MNNTIQRLGLVLIAAVTSISCGSDGDDGDVLGGVDALTQQLGKQCGIDVECKGGIVAGNASISGVPSVDAFFQSVINYRSKADGVSADIGAQLDAIRGDFGIDAQAKLGAAIKAKVTANVEGKLRVEAEPARCSVDAQATLRAQARCDASIDPGTATIECKGSCEVEASADVSCSAEADLQCTFTAPSAECTGECKGSCEADVEATGECSGTCNGECDGTCSAFSDAAGTQCAGSCAGKCTGKCKVELAASAKCEGSCEGECTVTNPEASCEGAIRASCKAKANAQVECKGRCVGEFEPPEAKVECEASARAEAKLNVECTPPRLVVAYRLKAAAAAELEAQAKFEAGVRNLKVRLPALLAAIDRAKLVATAGEDLGRDAGAAVKGAVMTAAGSEGKANLRAYFGLRCAVGQLDAVDDAVRDSNARLSATLVDANELRTGLEL